MTDKAISPLRRRLIEDMTIRRLSANTQHQYIRHVKTSQISWAGLSTRPLRRMSIATNCTWGRSERRYLTFAGMRGNDDNAPITDVPGIAISLPTPTAEFRHRCSPSRSLSGPGLIAV